jgi:putative endonuclease
MYFTYVLYSKTLSKRYVGSTGSIEKRLKEHNAGKSRFTKGGIPWYLIYKESFVTLSDARKRESFLKSGQGRKFLDEILNGVIEGSEP